LTTPPTLRLRIRICYPEGVPSYDEEKHLARVALVWAVVSFLLIAVAIGVLGFGMGLLVRTSMP